VNNSSPQLRILLIHSVPVEEEVRELRRLHVDAMAQSTEVVLSSNIPLDASSCVVIHPSVNPERCEEIREKLKQRNIVVPLLVASDEQPLVTALDIARAARRLMENAANPQEPPPKRPVSLGTKTILVVDDDAVLRRALKRTIRRIPASILEADDPEDADQFLSEFDIDLIMSDYSFAGGMNGLDFLADCRTQHPKIPRMLLSGHDLNVDLELPGDRTAADAILQKPWNHDEFLNTCRSLISGKLNSD